MILSFLKDESAATLVEYGLIVAIISLAAVAGLGVFSSAMKDMFSTFANTMDRAGH
jgi:pilus assembly protein Flp/PilA